MHHHNKLLTKIGKTREIAQALGIADPYVSKWRQGGIGKRWIPEVIRLARSKKIKVTLEDLFDV